MWRCPRRHRFERRGASYAAADDDVVVVVSTRRRRFDWCIISVRSYCGDRCRVVEGRDQVQIRADMGVVYGHIRDRDGEIFETDFEASVTYYIWCDGMD